MKKLALVSGGVLLAASVILELGGPLISGAPASAGEGGAGPAEAPSGGKYTLKVQISDLPPIPLRGVEGLEVSTEVVEFKDSSIPTRLRKLPGRTTYGSLRLKFDPAPTGDHLWVWYRDVLAGKFDRHKVIVILAQDGKDLRRYEFNEAWPCKWQGPQQLGADGAVEAEQVTITYETVERISI